ncbi:MAG: glycosyltransferase family 2 protein [Muribaculaceae bacterium]|nr:glycosyltransferase family 2 protein [Muribaculaceae bacterium]
MKQNENITEDIKPLVSIIIPAYNAAPFINRCVESALNQTYSDCEIIIVNDGSTDNTAIVVDGLAAEYDTIKVVHQENRGLAEARKSGIHASKGDYIVHLDADDWLRDDAVEILLKRCMDEDLDYCAGVPIEYFSETKRGVRQHPYTGIFNGWEFLNIILLPEGNLPSWGCISKRILWGDDIFPPATTILPNEDLPLNVGLTKRINRAGIFNDLEVSYYYMNPQSLTSLGVLFQQERWASFFAFIRSQLLSRRLLAKTEPKIRLLEIDHLAFHVKIIKKNDSWVQGVYKYDSSGFPTKYRILHKLIKHPYLCRFLLRTYQTLKARVTNSREPFKQ